MAKKKVEVLKPYALQEFRKWRREQFSNIKQREEELVSQLRAVAPESTQPIIRPNKSFAYGVVLNDLIGRGWHIAYYSGSGADDFEGYRDWKQLESELKKLGEALKDVVEITIEYGRNRFFHTYKVNICLVKKPTAPIKPRKGVKP